MKKHRKKNNVFLFLLVIVLLATIFFSGTKLIELLLINTSQTPEPVSKVKTIERNGKEYFPRQDITVFMVMGIDQNGKVKSSGSYNNSGEADMISLVVFDETNKSYKVVLLNRDTMMDIQVLGVGGKIVSTTKAQVALSHTYGSGLEDSCENTVDAVSKFFYGLNIDYYAAMNMDAISIITDAVDGVEVTVTDDFSKIDSSIPMGKTVLDGDQAINFIQARKDVSDQLNISRMERHKSFMDGFINAFSKKINKGSSTFIADTYSDVDDYMVTDCSVTTMNSLMNHCGKYKFEGVISPKGENVLSNEYVEYHIDEKALDDFILDNFYDLK